MWEYRSLPLLVLLLVTIGTCYSVAVGVRTSVGDITGFTENVFVDGQMKPIAKFLGIPYAEPPIGDNRFNKPVPKRNFTAPFNATAYPPSCFQTRQDTMPYSEDCLFLNVYVPGTFDLMTSYPVMVWIHGGAFVSGTSSEYPAEVLSTFGNVVVVTLNYRLAAFGFLSSPDGSLIGNQGLWDQQLALEWVKSNIQYFHGNPDNITIFGESAGSISVIAQSLYAGNRGVFNRAIAQSGSVFEGLATKTTNIEAVLNQTGCAGTLDPVACLRAKPAQELIKVNLNFAPVVDGSFLVDLPDVIVTGSDPTTSAAREFFGSLDILTGVCAVDGGYQMAFYWPLILGENDFNKLTISRTQFENIIIPTAVDSLLVHDPKLRSIVTQYMAFEYTDWSDPDNITRIRDKVVDLSSDSLFFRAMTRTAQEHSKISKGRTYVYELDVTPTYHLIATPTWIKGTGHADDIQYMFGNPISNLTPERSNYTDAEKNVAKAMMTMWTNFATTGDPNTPNDVMTFLGTTWPEYEMTSQNYLKITERLSDKPIQQRFNPQRMAFWLEILPKIMNS